MAVTADNVASLLTGVVTGVAACTPILRKLFRMIESLNRKVHRLETSISITPSPLAPPPEDIDFEGVTWHGKAPKP